MGGRSLSQNFRMFSLGDDRQTDPEIKRCGPSRVRADALHASVRCDPRQELNLGEGGGGGGGRGLEPNETDCVWKPVTNL